MTELLNDLETVLYADLTPLDPQSMPLLAHYTTLNALEKIIRNDEIWFSHPTLMNDHAEVRDGIQIGTQFLLKNQVLAETLGDFKGCLMQGLVDAHNEYGTVHLYDTFIFSLSEHSADDYNGRLSMWRGYGADGNGAAIVINPGKLVVTAGSPLVFERVHYLTPEARLAWLQDFCQRIAACVAGRTAINADWYQAGKNVFERIKLAAVFSKHIGFAEEFEWRVVYMPERDQDRLLKDQISYFNGPRGLEPKLKYKLKPQPKVSEADPGLLAITDRIILGPSRANLLLVNTAKRMLEDAGKPQLCDRIWASTIPFRSFV